MKQNKLFINNPVTLHFYNPEEQLPDTDEWKIVIVKTYDKAKMDFRIVSYSYEDRKFYDDHLYPIEKEDVIAWATFSPEWVVSENDRDIFGCK